MRDLLISAILGSIILLALTRPIIGAYGWAWFSIFNPHQLTYSFARSVPWGQAFALITLIGFLFTKNRHPFPWTSITKLYVMLIAWMTFTSLFALAPPSMVWDQWIFVLKIHLMIFVTLMLARGKEQINVLVWILALSIGFYGFKAGIWVLLTGGSGRVYGPQGGLLGNNNEFANGLILTIPLLYYFATTTSQKFLRYGLWIAIPACFMAVLGSHSRGAFLGLTVMAIFLGVLSRKSIAGKLFVPFIIVAILLLGMALMPENWTERMNTIKTYQQDDSAMNRVEIWKMIWKMSLDSPIVGGGFRLDNQEFFGRYANPSYIHGVLGPHSIYFQALGEHGYIGLILYLALGVSVWRTAGRIIKRCEAEASIQWAATLARMIQVSLIGFSIAGAFGAWMHLDLVYYLIAIIVLTDLATQEDISNKKYTTCPYN